MYEAWQSVWSDATKTRQMMNHMYGHSRIYETLAEHYDVTAVSLQRAVWPHPDTRPEPRVWSNTDWASRELVFDYHPDLIAHKLSADVLFHAWQRLEELNVKTTAASLQRTLPETPYSSEIDLKKSASCPYMEAMVSSRSDGKPARSEGWRLFEDRPGKPGWITTNKISENSSAPELVFVLPCGHRGYFGVEYLRSYDTHMGQVEFALRYSPALLVHKFGTLYENETELDAIMKLPIRRKVVLNGHWKDPFSLSENHLEKVDCVGGNGGNWNPVALTIRSIDKGARLSLEAGRKFKVISVFAC